MRSIFEFLIRLPGASTLATVSLSCRVPGKWPLKQKTELALLERSSSPAVLIGAHASLQDVLMVAQSLGNGHGDKFS